MTIRMGCAVIAGATLFGCGEAPPKVGTARSPLVEAALVDLGLGASSTAYDVNDSQQIVGYYHDPAWPAAQAFRWSESGVTTLLAPGYSSGNAIAMNALGDTGGNVYDSGVVRPAVWPVGSTSPTVLDVSSGVVHHLNTSLQAAGNGSSRGFFWSQSTGAMDLGHLGADYTLVYGMNELGQVVGMSVVHSAIPHAYVWENGTMTDLGTLGGTQSGAFDVNDLGVVVGGAMTPAEVLHATMWVGGVAIDVDPTNPEESIAYAVNDSGHMVGIRRIGGVKHATLWRDGVAIDLNAGPHSEANDINELGVVLGKRGSGAPFVWVDAMQGPLDLPVPDGTTSASAHGISATMVVGRIDPAPGAVAWQLSVSPPEPNAGIGGLADSVDGLEQDGALEPGEASSLESKLEAAQHQCDRGNEQAARNQLKAFMNHVAAYVAAGKLTAAEGQSLLDEAEQALLTLDCEA